MPNPYKPTATDAAESFLGKLADRLTANMDYRRAEATRMNLLNTQQSGALAREQATQSGLDERTKYIQGQENDRNKTTTDANTAYHNAVIAVHRESIKALGDRAKEKKGMTDQKALNYVQDYYKGADNAALGPYANAYESGGAQGLDAFEAKNGPPEGATPKGPTDTQVEQHANELVTRWQKSRYNNDPNNQGRFGFTPQTGYEAPPMWGGKSMPEEYDRAVATIAAQKGIEPQEAANIAYAAKIAVDLGNKYSTDFRTPTLDVAKLHTLPALKGRSLNVDQVDGKTSIGELAKLAVHGWTDQEVQQLLDQYFGVGAQAPNPRKQALQGAGLVPMRQ